MEPAWVIWEKIWKKVLQITFISLFSREYMCHYRELIPVDEVKTRVEADDLAEPIKVLREGSAKKCKCKKASENHNRD